MAVQPQQTLLPSQIALVNLPADRRIFLEGAAGTGKTTAAVARLLALLRAGVPADEILILLPQRTLATPYTDALRRPAVPAGGEVTVLTWGGLAQRMTELFWPLIAGEAGFAAPNRPPVFLTLETAQYFMARIVAPLLDAGYFDSIAVDRNRLYSQILDNLNKAASVGFAHTEIGERLKSAWVGESAQARVYDEAQECATRFRSYCLAHNLLDFSLQYEVFARHLWPLPQCREMLLGRYRHLIADNVEEDTPVSHDLLLDWLAACRSALIVYDVGAGYRRFLGADPISAYRLKAQCGERLVFNQTHIMSTDIAALGIALGRALGPQGGQRQQAAGPAALGRVYAEELTFAEPTAAEPAAEPLVDALTSPRSALDFTAHRFHPEMLDWLAAEIAGLVHDQGVPPKEIVVLAPFLGGGLRFSLEARLAARAVPVRSHRPSRALNEEPATGCLLTLAALCHPTWGIVPSRFDVAYALMQAIEGMDLVRAQLLAEIAYRVREGAPTLSAFDEIEPEMQERITFLLGGRYEGLRTWVAAHAKAAATAAGPRRHPATRRRAELDHFFSRLFGELLSQPGYGFHGDFDAGEITANVIESARKFRQVMAEAEPDRQPELSREYVQLVREGVVAAQYVRSWQRQPENAVLLAPAYTFLMSNRAVDHQFWLDVGSPGWWERLYQPLTQPYVLSRRWQAGTPWTDLDEYSARQEALACLALGLVRRCRVRVHLGLSEMGEQGLEQRGPLLRAIQRVLRDTQP